MDALWRQKESIDAPGVAAKDFGVVFAPSSSSGFSGCISHHNASKSLAIGGTSGFRVWWAGKFPGRVSTTVFAQNPIPAISGRATDSERRKPDRIY